MFLITILAVLLFVLKFFCYLRVLNKAFLVKHLQRQYGVKKEILCLSNDYEKWRAI